MRHHLTTFVLAVALAGCKDREVAAPPAAPSTTPAAMQRAAYLSVSDLSPAVGSTIIVAGNIGIGDSLSLASFKVRLAYDAKALYYLGEVESPGMMRVINPQDYEIIVAGASGSGSVDGRLFAMKFRVDDVDGLTSLRLSVDEMNDTNFNSQLSSLKQEPSLQLDRKLVAGRSIPR